jgi:adenine-specific DNA-methyltransferase
VAGRELFASGRKRAQKWVHADDEGAQLRSARAFCTALLNTYWSSIQPDRDSLPLPPFVERYETASLTKPAQKLARRLGEAAGRFDPMEAGYRIGRVYTATLPSAYQSQHGIYYTPPALTQHLLTLATQAGVDWTTDTVLDPACGGGAFLAPVALHMAEARGENDPSEILQHVADHLHGYEIDPFGAWTSQVILEVALLDVCRAAGRRLPTVVEVADSLDRAEENEQFDCVLGNPPYGRVTLSSERREQFDRSLYGHANVYGLFTDLALRLAAPDGRVAFVSPTGFLAGQYFKAFRGLLGREAPPARIDFLSVREGVFADVLQETLLAVYDKSRNPSEQRAQVCVVSPTDQDTLDVEEAGMFRLPDDPTQPWVIPRRSEQGPLVEGMNEMAHRTHDYGYEISTGPLVWNRHKERLRAQSDSDTHPLIWAEAVTADGDFQFRAEKPNHEPYFAPADDQDWLVVRQPCVLVQRTTAKEQHRRLIAAELPESFVEKHDGVVVENHLNMVYPAADPSVSVPALAALLNSEIVDQAFRCISGSVAVSAYEMEALPLPSIETMQAVEALLQQGASADQIESLLRDAYLS